MDKKNRAGFMFIELLLVLCIIAFIAYNVFKLYLKKPYLNQETQQVMLKEGIDTTNYKSIIDSAKKNVQDYQRHFKEMGNTEIE